MGNERNWRIGSQPAIVAITVMFVVFLLDLVFGIVQLHADVRAGMQIVVGATGVFGSIVLFVIGFVINRLK